MLEHMSTRNITATLNKTKLTTYFLLLVSLSLVFLYMFLVATTALHAVYNKEHVSQMRVVQTDIIELEAQLIDAQHFLSEELAIQSGFLGEAEKVFITSDKFTQVLGVNIQ